MSVNLSPAATLAAALFAAACAQRDTADLSSLTACATYEPAGLGEGSCRLEANGETMQVEFAAPNNVGVVAIRVIDHTGGVRQVIMEENVDGNIAPYAQDVDGDGRADIIVPRSLGNVNTVSALWLLTGDGYYRRLGEVNGYAFVRGDDGLLTVTSRSSAAEQNVAYYAMDEGALRLVASVNFELGEDGERRGCALADAPGIAGLALTAEQAQTRFCGTAPEVAP